jgi:hypothetical protein
MEAFGNVAEMVQLYERALRDMKYFEVSKAYCKFVEGAFYSSVVRLEDLEKVLEKLIDRFFYDFDRSSYFFRRKLKVLQKIAPSGRKQNQEAIEFQKKIRECFQRMLRIPSADLALTFEKYQEWEQVREEKDKGEAVYNQTLEQVSKIIDCEERFQALMDAKNLDSLCQFVKTLGSSTPEILSRSRVIYYYELLVENFATNCALWFQYHDFVKESKGSPTELHELLRRASRNCFNNQSLAILYLQSCEAIRTPPAALSSILNQFKSLVGSLPDSQDHNDYLSAVFLWEAGALSRRFVASFLLTEPNEKETGASVQKERALEEETNTCQFEEGMT